MIGRRDVLLGGAALAVAGMGAAWAGDAPRLRLSAGRSQGGLVWGRCASAPAEATLDGNPLRVTPDGLLAFAIAYDRAEPLSLRLRFSDGLVVEESVVPVVRQYHEQRIDGLDENYVSPPDEIVARIRAENALVFKVREADSDLTDFAESFDWPSAGIVSGVFGSRRILNGQPRRAHFGVDIAGPEGTPIHAPVGGVVTLCEPDFYLTGGTTVIDHGHGVSTVYLHQSTLDVRVGDRVERGQAIGRVGATGRATGPHLHWGMNWFQMRLDPALSTAASAPPPVSPAPPSD